MGRGCMRPGWSCGSRSLGGEAPRRRAGVARLGRFRRGGLVRAGRAFGWRRAERAWPAWRCPVCVCQRGGGGAGSAAGVYREKDGKRVPTCLLSPKPSVTGWRGRAVRACRTIAAAWSSLRPLSPSVKSRFGEGRSRASRRPGLASESLKQRVEALADGHEVRPDAASNATWPAAYGTSSNPHPRPTHHQALDIRAAKAEVGGGAPEENGLAKRQCHRDSRLWRRSGRRRSAWQLAWLALRCHAARPVRPRKTSAQAREPRAAVNASVRTIFQATHGVTKSSRTAARFSMRVGSPACLRSSLSGK